MGPEEEDLVLVGGGLHSGLRHLINLQRGTKDVSRHDSSGLPWRDPAALSCRPAGWTERVRHKDFKARREPFWPQGRRAPSLGQGVRRETLPGQQEPNLQPSPNKGPKEQDQGPTPPSQPPPHCYGKGAWLCSYMVQLSDSRSPFNEPGQQDKQSPLQHPPRPPATSSCLSPPGCGNCKLV